MADRIATLRALLASATPGPWDPNPADVAAIAALRNHADALLDCAEALAEVPAVLDASMTGGSSRVLSDWWRDRAAPALARLGR